MISLKNLIIQKMIDTLNLKSNIMDLDYKLEIQEEMYEKCNKLESIIVNKICEITNMLDNTFEW